MKYTLKDWELDGTLTDNGDDTSTQPIIIIPIIEGDLYGFVSPAPSKNQMKVIIPNKNLDIDQIKAFIQPLAEAFCAAQYPDTP